MATETILTEDEQAQIYHKKGYELGAELAKGWEATIDNPAIAPAAHLGAIESLVVALLRLVGSEATLAFLNRLTDDISNAPCRQGPPRDR
jgi:hypothetical protein